MTTVVSLSGSSAKTLGDLKARIAREMNRTDLTTLIAENIEDAISDYQSVRFEFNQARASFDTVAGTEFYGGALPTDIGQIDSIVATVNGRRSKLAAWPFAVMEQIATTTSAYGEPSAWSWYAQQLRLYPVPDAVYALTLSYVQRIDVPANDGQSNVWTDEAEALIRHSVKRRIAQNYMRDAEMAQAARSAEADAYRRLMRDVQQLDTGGLVPSM